jgi:hypothetical protein
MADHRIELHDGAVADDTKPAAPGSLHPRYAVTEPLP